MTEDRRRLILSCVHWDQFIFLIAEDDPMRCPRMDHYGFAVGSLDELAGIQERAEAFRKADDRMELIDLHVDDQKVVKIHSLYVRYLLPMTIEFQYWEFPEPERTVGPLTGASCRPRRYGAAMTSPASAGATSRTVPLPARPRPAAPHAQRLGRRLRRPVRLPRLRGDRHHERRLRRHAGPPRRGDDARTRCWPTPASWPGRSTSPSRPTSRTASPHDPEGVAATIAAAVDLRPGRRLGGGLHRRHGRRRSTSWRRPPNASGRRPRPPTPVPCPSS